MRARSSRSTKKSTASVKPPGVGKGRSISLLTALLLVLGMLTPFAVVQQVAASTNGKTDLAVEGAVLQGGGTPLQGVFGVTIGGDVANTVGPVQLSNQGSGIWVGTAPLPPGGYSFDVNVSTNDGNVNVGSSSVNVTDGSAGAVFQFDSNTGNISAGPLVVSLNTDYGSFPMIPDSSGNFSVTFDASPGSPVNVETVVDGAPTGITAQPVGGNGGRVRVVSDASGNILQAGGVDSAQLQVSKSDSQGNPQPGACFAVTSGGSIASQACDSSDGSNDGNITLNFPNGVPSGGNLVETFTPNGQEAASDQEIGLSPGFNQAQANVVGASGGEEEPSVEPTEESQPPQQQTGSVTIFATDQNGSPLAGACFQLDNVGQQCDDDQDSVTTFSDVPFGSYTVSATQAPQGYDNGQSQQVDVQGDQQLSFAFPQSAPSTANLTLIATDQNGSPLPGACFQIDGVGQQCDDDQNGQTTFDGLPLGTYNLSSTQAPQGYDNIQPTQIQVTGDQQMTVPFAQSAPQTGTIAAVTVDENGQQLQNVCYNLSTFGQQCDGDDDDAVMTQTDVPAGDYTVELIVPDGYQAVGSTQQQITVQGGETSNVNFQVQSVAAATFSVNISTVDQNGSPLPGACYQMDSAGQQCDDDGDGVTTFTGVDAGAYNIFQTTAPQGYELASPQQVDVQSDQQLTFTNESSQVAPAATDTPEAPPAEATETPTEEGTQGFSVGLVALDPDNNVVPGACYQLDSGETQCDDDGDGTVTFTGVSAGSHTATMTQAPQGFENVGTVGVDVTGDQQFAVRLTPSQNQGGGTGTIAASVVDENGNAIPGACFEIVGITSDCDGDDEDALMTQPDVPAGTYTVNLTVPDGYSPLGPTSQQATVTADQTTNVQFQVTSAQGVPTETPTQEAQVEPTETPTEETGPPARGFGSLAVTVTDGGFPILGACVSYQGPANGEVCDGDANDADPAQASILIDDLPAGNYQVSMPNPPAGFDPAAPVSATITDGSITSLVLQTGGAVAPAEPTETPTEVVIPTDTPTETPTLVPTETPTLEPTATPTETAIPAGSFRVVKRDADGNRLDGSCWSLTGATNLGPYCDNDANDLDARPGVIEVGDIPAGDYTLTESTVPAGYLAVADQPISITPGERTGVSLVDEQETGSIVITKTDDQGTALGGACFSVGDQNVCDDGEGDAQNTVPGTIEIDGLVPGDYQITETQAPDGYVASADPVGVTVSAGAAATATFQNGRATGSIQITKVDIADVSTPLGGACFQVAGQTVCDNSDGDGNDADGVILISNLPAGPQTVTETQAPDGYRLGQPIDVTVTVDQTATVTVGDSKLTGSLQIVKVDAADGTTTLGGACFSIDGGDPICDNGDGDTDSNTGSLVIDGLAPGTYQVAETQAPEGYEISGDPQSVDVTADQTASLTFADTASAGQIRILKVDKNGGGSLAGACFTIDDGLPICDNQTGDLDPADGVILVDATSGDRLVTEVTAPEGYDPVLSPQTVTVANGETAEVTFENSAFTGSVRITKTDNDTQLPLGGACFTLQDADGNATTPVCDNGEGDSDPADGVIVLQGVTAGTYDLYESTTPDGYVAPEGAVATGVQVTSGQEAEVSVGNEPVDVPTPTPIPAGSVLIDKVDENGNALAGACFQLSGATTVGPVCDQGPADTDATEGKIGIANVPEGAYTLIETQAPDGYSQAANQDITVNIGETATVQVVDSPTTPEVGVLQINVADGSGNTLGGACFTYGGSSICDNGVGDEDPAVGVIRVSGVRVGTYQVVNTVAPANFDTGAPQSADITAGQTTTVDFALAAAAPQTGGLQLELKDDQGNPVTGACVSLVPSSNVAGGETIQLCDGGAEDTNPAPGVLVVEDLPVGTWTVNQDDIPGTDAVPAAAVGADVSAASTGSNSKTVTVKANVIVIVIIIIIVQPPTEGSLQIVKRAADTNLLQGGACFQVTGPNTNVEVCDNDGVDQNTTVGVILLTNLPEGDYTVHETQAPPGYDPAADQTATVVGGLKTVITVKDQKSNTPGSLKILKMDGNGDPVLGTCFALRQGNNNIYGPICDNADGANDGTITFTNLTPGSYTLRETTTAGPNWQTIPDQAITILAGANPDVPVVNVLKTGSVRITKQNKDGTQQLPGACFGLDRGNGLEFVTCDNGAGDADPAPGIILIKNVPPDAYALIETQAPAGYDVGANVDITVQPAQTVEVAVRNSPTPPPADTGNLTIQKRDQQGNALAGACFILKQGNVTKYGPVCDEDDGSSDGTISFTKVGVGDYGLVETRKPSADYQTPPVIYVTITKNQTKTQLVTNVLRPGLIQITKVDQQGNPLTGACFRITPGNLAVQCTDGTGQVVFSNLPPGVYTVTETKAPYGYQLAPAVTNVVVKPGLTTPLTIVDKHTTPPADAGSIKVIKFYCPQTTKGETTTVYDSSDPVQAPLALTANCKKGDATFTLSRKDGAGTPITFSTGADGEAHLTLQAGVYILTEKGTNTKVEVTVFVGQQTTVVVLNYVAPPKPAPVTVEVRKYTCDPGFQGQFYLDFISSCGAASSLTNGVEMRLSGAAINQTRFTGDTGQIGLTRFTQLTPGNYSLQEKAPDGSSVFVWCGVSLDSYEFGAIGSIINFPLQSGQTMYCAYFNVPDKVTDTTGTIVVQKYGCELPAVKRPANFDWFDNCSVQTTGVRFTISQLVNGQYVPRLAGVTDANGLLKFTDLAPGTYKLQEVGADWCHAESDAVNAQGDVVVQAGKRSSVWIFNCVPTNQPPNTGSGSTAGMVLPGLSPGGSSGVVPQSAVAMEMHRRLQSIFG